MSLSTIRSLKENNSSQNSFHPALKKSGSHIETRSRSSSKKLLNQINSFKKACSSSGDFFVKKNKSWRKGTVLEKKETPLKISEAFDATFPQELIVSTIGHKSTLKIEAKRLYPDGTLEVGLFNQATLELECGYKLTTTNECFYINPHLILKFGPHPNNQERIDIAEVKIEGKKELVAVEVSKEGVKKSNLSIIEALTKYLNLNQSDDWGERLIFIEKVLQHPLLNLSIYEFLCHIHK